MKLPVLLLTFLAGISLASQLDANADEPLKVFVFAGQSNMVGLGSQVRSLPSNLSGQKNDVLFWTGRNWKPYSPGTGQDSGFGPEVSCGFELAKALGEPIGIIKLSVGGSDLAKRWNPRNSESLYHELKKSVQTASRSRPIAVAGMFWMQGETDAGKSETANAYAYNLDTLIAQARRDFKNPAMIFISGRIGLISYPFVGVVRRAQEKRRRFYDWIELDRLSKLPDDVHYDTRGIVKLGQLFAKKFQDLSRS